MIRDLRHGLNPAPQPLLERLRIDPDAHTREGVLGGDAVGQLKEAGESSPAVEAELLDRGERVGPGEDAADSDDEEVNQGVVAGPLDARAIAVLKVVLERGGLATGQGVTILPRLIESSP